MSTTFATTERSLSLEGNLDPFILIKSSTLVTEALEKLSNNSEKFALVGETISKPETLLSETHLEALATDCGHLTLAQVRIKLPALLLVHHNVNLQKEERLVFYSQLMYGTTAPGLVIWDGEKSLGAVSIDLIFERAGRHLDRDKYEQFIVTFTEEPVTARRVYDILAADIDWCIFFCTNPNCNGAREEPTCTPPPVCPRDPSHGTMQERP